MNSLTDPKYEKLKDMEAFTEAMFNRIIGFQEKKHPAWDESLPFEQRIAELPLHYLVFSSADRDPRQFASTVAPYYPLRAEFLRIKDYYQQLALSSATGQGVVCDCHANNGFIGSLMAREQIPVKGIRNPAEKPNQIANFYDSQCYRLYTGDLQAPPFQWDVAFSSWMPGGQNLTPLILKNQAKMLIFVYTEHEEPQKGQRQTGTAEAFAPPKGYHLIDEWSIMRPENLFHDVWPDLTPNIEEVRHTKIYALENLVTSCISIIPDPDHGYPWEKDLELALLTLQAKQALQRMGFPVP